MYLALTFCLHEFTYQRSNLIGFGVQREVACVQDIDLSIRYILAVALRLTKIERKIVLAPEHQELGLRLLHPRLPLRIRIDIRAVVKEKVTLDLSLTWRIQKCVLIGPKIRVVELRRILRLP